LNFGCKHSILCYRCNIPPASLQFSWVISYINVELETNILGTFSVSIISVNGG
jgi:hypothetical protein